MKPFRSTIVLAVAVCLLSALSFWAYSRRSSQEEHSSKQKVVGKFDPENILKIKLNNTHGTVAFVRKPGSFSASWWIEGTQDLPADFREVQFLLQKFSTLQAIRLLEKTSKNVSEFGLQNPRIRLQFIDASNSFEFLIGNTTPFGKEIFLKLENDPRIFVVADDFTERLNRKSVSFEKYYFLEPSVLESKEIMFESPGKTWTAHFAGNHWEIVEGKKLRIDNNQDISNLLEGLKDVSIDSRPTLVLKDQDSAFKITFLMKNAQPFIVQFFNPPAAQQEGLIYATFPPEPFIYGINRILVERLQGITAE